MYLEALELCSKDPQAAARKIVALEEAYHSLEKQVRELVDQVNELKLQKAKHSKNSSKPPSTDGFKKPKPNPKSRRRKTGRKSAEEMEVLFTFLAERYERRSLMITSNLVFSQRDRIFKDSMTTAAEIDRLVHHSTILELTTESYRMKVAGNRTCKELTPSP